MVYLDTSVLGSYYCAESLSATVSAALAPLTRPVVSNLVELEFLSLVSLKVRTRDLGRPDARKVIDLFRDHLSTGLYERIETAPAHFTQAGQWIAGLVTPLRTLDALHLAMAHANNLELWTTDKKLAASADALKLRYRLIR